MKSQLLIDHKFKKMGWIILLPSIILALLISIFHLDFLELKTKTFALVYTGLLNEEYEFFKIVETDLSLTILGVCIIIGALLVCFSKEKIEDEFIAESRLNALQWAIFINYSFLLFAFVFFYGTIFLSIIIYSAFTPLLIFIIRFHYILYKNQKAIRNEKQD